MESCDLRLALDQSAGVDVGHSEVTGRCRRTAPLIRGERLSRRSSESAMAALLKAPAFRQYSELVEDATAMSRQNLVEFLRSNLFSSVKPDLGAYLDGRRRPGVSTRRYFSVHDRDVVLTSSGDDSPDDDVMGNLLRGGRAMNGHHRAFRMPSFAEFVAERSRSRGAVGTDEQWSRLKVSEGQRCYSEVASVHRRRLFLFFFLEQRTNSLPPLSSFPLPSCPFPSFNLLCYL